MDNISRKSTIDGLWSSSGGKSHYRWVVNVSWIILVSLALTGIFAEFIAPYDPYKINLAESLHSPSRNHWFGTDILGRDILSRLIYGSRTTLLVSFASVGTASSAGTLFGLIAGYSGPLVSMIIMRIADGIMCFPTVALALFISVMLGGDLGGVIVALSFASIAGYARLMNGLTLSIKEKDYIAAAHSIGASSIRILVIHILPNALPFIIVQVTVQLGTVILAEAGLSFLGVGIQPPGASWGSMIADGYAFLEKRPLVAFAPGTALMLVAFAFNTIGDFIRTTLDPRVRT